MIGRRGNVRLIQSDNDSNFLATKNELKMAFLNNKKIVNFFKTKVLIGLKGKEIHLQPATWVLSGKNKLDLHCATSIFLSLLKTHSQCLNDYSFCTLMAEVDGIMNSSPLTVGTSTDITVSITLPCNEVQGCDTTCRQISKGRSIH